MSDDLEFSETTSISFFVRGIPKAQPRVKAFARKMGSKFVARVFTPGTAEEWKGHIAFEAAQHVPPAPFDGPVRVDLIFVFPRPKAHFRGKAMVLRDNAPVFHVSKPDRDNSDKAVLDALTHIGGFWRDDAQVADGRIQKLYGDQPGCLITITPL